MAAAVGAWPEFAAKADVDDRSIDAIADVDDRSIDAIADDIRRFRPT